MNQGRFDAWTHRFAVAEDRRGVLAAAVGALLAAAGFGVADDAAARQRDGRPDGSRDNRPARQDDHDDREGGGAGAGVAKRRRRRPRPRPKPCQSDAECGECGSCNADGRCEANDGRCSDCRRCNKQTLRCGGGCERGKLCCGGACAVPGPDTCCAKPEHCGPAGGCLDCRIETGRCEPKPDGRECDGCKRCQDGACGEPDAGLLCDGVCCVGDEVCVGRVAGIGGTCCPVASACADECCGAGKVCTRENGCCPEGRQCGANPGAGFAYAECCDADERCVGDACCPAELACGDRCCPENHRCARGGGCCAKCLEDGACCPRGSKCINPGPFAGNSCCDVSANTPCGDNGDGTFKECCIGGIEQCCNGVCVPKGSCCADGRSECDGSCCPEGFDCCDGACIDTRKSLEHCGACGNACIPKKERCVDGVCRDICSMNQGYTKTCEHNGNYFCCYHTKGCCGAQCCG